MLARKVVWDEEKWWGQVFGYPKVVYKVWVPERDEEDEENAEDGQDGEILEEDGRYLWEEWDESIATFGRYVEGCRDWDRFMAETESALRACNGTGTGKIEAHEEREDRTAGEGRSDAVDNVMEDCSAAEGKVEDDVVNKD